MEYSEVCGIIDVNCEGYFSMFTYSGESGTSVATYKVHNLKFSHGRYTSTAIDIIYLHVCVKRSVGRTTKVQNHRGERMSTYISCGTRE